MALIRQADGLQLPVVQVPSPAWPPEDAPNINAELMEQYGLNCTMMRWLDQQADFNLLVMEWHPDSSSPDPGVEWLDPRRNDLGLPPLQSRMVRKWLESSSNDLAPWENPGWMKQVVASLIGIFNGRRYPQLSTLAQVKAAWGMSTLLYIEAQGEAFFFKAGTRQGVEEWKVTRFLHNKFPQYVADPLPVDEQRDWMITRKIETLAFNSFDHDSLRNAFRAYAEIQLACEDLVHSDLAGGLRVRHTAWLKNHLNAFFSDDRCPAEFKEPKAQLGISELADLRINWLRQIEALETSCLPMGFNQEDLHLENILNTPNGPMFIDWADCALSHPFFGVQRPLRLWRGEDPETIRVEKEIVKKTYLDAFSHLAGHDQLSREFEMTEQLSLLYDAFRCQEISREQKSDSPFGVHCFKRAERYMKDAIERCIPGIGNL